MKIRFLHLADVFLGCQNFYLGDRARDRNDDFRAAFRDAVEYALNPRHEIDGVLIAGNLFDSHRPSEELWNFAKGLISRLLAKDILVAVVPGSHDSYAYKHSVWRTERMPGVELFLDTEPTAPRVHNLRGQRVFLYGLAYVPGQTPQPLPEFSRAEEKGVHLALLNGRAAENKAELESGPTQELVFDIDALAKTGFDYVALGGRRQFEERLMDGSVLAWSGSLEGRGFDPQETGDKGPLIVEIDDQGVHLERMVTNRKTIQRVKLDLKDERITDADALENAIRTLGGRDAIVEVTLSGTAEFLADLEEIQDDLRGEFYHLVISDESRIADSALLRKIESENTIRGYFVRKLGERIEAVQKEIAKKGETPERLRRLALHENALKIGVEQFIEEESPADSIYSLISDSDEQVATASAQDAKGVGHLEDRVKAMLAYRKQQDASASDDETGSDTSPTPTTGVDRENGASRGTQNGHGRPSLNAEIDFSDDRLGLIIGRNEAGKSTLMSAIFGVLFGFKDQALQKKFEPWDAYEDYAGEVWIRDEEGRLVVVKRQFLENTAEIGIVEDGKYEAEFLGSANPRGHSDEDIEYYKRLEAIVGFQDEAVFRGTVFVGQSALEVSINDQIRKLVSGSGSTDFKGALHDLHSRFSELTMENPWRSRSKSRPRKIEKTKAHLSDTVSNLETARETFLKTMSLESELKKLEQKQQSNKDELEDTKKTLSHFERFCKLIRDRDTASERFKEANKRREDVLLCRKKVAACDKEIQSNLAHFTEVGDAFPELVTQLKAETRQLETEEDLVAREKKALKDLVPQPNDKLGFALGALGLAVGVVVLVLAGTVPGVAAGLVLAVGLFFLGRKLATGYKERVAELELSIRDHSRAVTGRRETISSLIEESGGVLGEGDPDRILVDYRRFRKLTEDRAKQFATMNVLGDWESIDATYQRAAEENLRCNGLLDLILRDAPYLTEISSDPVAVAKAMEQLKRRSQDLETEIEVSSEVITEARIELARVAGNEGLDLPVLEEEVHRTSRKLENLEFERDSLKVVIDTLEECVEEFQEGDLTQLSDEVSDLFRKITSNRYTRVTLSPNMDPMLTKYDNTHIHPDDLSQGTRDQLYFAMRVAIARHLSKRVALPFFLDDPFVNFDQERLDVTKEMLEQIDDHQVVLVTCDRHYESWSDRILDLDKARAESVLTSGSVSLKPRGTEAGVAVLEQPAAETTVRAKTGEEVEEKVLETEAELELEDEDDREAN